VQYNLITDKFGGVNYLAKPSIIGPGGAQSLLNVDTSTGTLKNAIADESITGSTVADAMHDFNGIAIESTTPDVFMEHGGRVYRMFRKYVDASVGANVQVATYSRANSGLWDVAGIAAPPVAMVAADSGAGAGGPNGAYLYYVTFTNDDGDESPPSPASISLTVVDNTITLSAIPIGYGTGDLNTSTSITNVTNVSSFRRGMRIQSPTAGIPANAYITNINGTTITISAAATATTAGVILQDAQVTGRKVYRQGGTVAYALLQQTIADITSTTGVAADTTADSDLGDEITTSGFDVWPRGIYGGAVSPDGVMMGLRSSNPFGSATPYKMYYSDPGRPWLVKSTSYIPLSDLGACLAFTRDRFILLTVATLNVVLGSTVDDLEIIDTGLPAPCGSPLNSAFGYPFPVEMPNGTWFTCKSGVMLYDGNTLTNISLDWLTVTQRENIHTYALAACRLGDKFVLLSSADTPASTHVRYLYVYDPGVPGWRVHGPYTTTSYHAAMAFFPSLNRVRMSVGSGTHLIFNAGETTSGSVGTGGTYRTGEWTGKNIAALKKFRKLAILHDGAVSVQPYIDGVTSGSAVTLTRTTPGRSSFWLPSGAKGRTLSLAFTLTNAAAEVYEVTALVGEEREALP